MGSASDTALRIGTLFAGRYVIERSLGAGGMGQVFLAYEPAYDRRVALKVLLDERWQSLDDVARFQREARTLTLVRHPHVARGLATGCDGRGIHYLAMEYVAGEDLAAYLARHGPLPEVVAAALVAQACSGIAAAHAVGVVHRDVKLRNLCLTAGADGGLHLKVIDFGIAKSSSDADVTRTSEVFGSPEYMSPEQVRTTKDTDLRTDVWSLGVCLYELLTGRVPFAGSSVLETGAGILFDPPPAIASLRPDVAPALAAIVRRCLEKEPARRFQDAREVAAALRAFVARRRGGPSASAKRRVSRSVAHGVFALLAVATVTALLISIRAVRHVRDRAQSSRPSLTSSR